MIETMRSLKVSAEGGNAAMTGMVNGPAALGAILPMGISTRPARITAVRRAPVQQVGPPATAPAPPAP
jgi:hypothetical protein